MHNGILAGNIPLLQRGRARHTIFKAFRASLLSMLPTRIIRTD